MFLGVYVIFARLLIYDDCVCSFLVCHPGAFFCKSQKKKSENIWKKNLCLVVYFCVLNDFKGIIAQACVPQSMWLCDFGDNQLYLLDNN